MALTQDELKELLHYDPDTGIFTWKPRPLESFKSERAFKMWNNRYAHKRAGYDNPNKKGYYKRLIKIKDKKVLEHRLAWLYMTGEYGPKEIDHEDRDATNNAWANLRDGSNGKNQKNVSKRELNTSGVTGMRFKLGKWEVNVGLDRKTHYLGRYADKDEAMRVLQKFYQDNGFSQGHGT